MFSIFPALCQLSFHAEQRASLLNMMEDRASEVGLTVEGFDAVGKTYYRHIWIVERTRKQVGAMPL